MWNMMVILLPIIYLIKQVPFTVHINFEKTLSYEKCYYLLFITGP